MHEVRIQVEVPAPLEAVWKVFTDYRRWPDWSGVKEVVLRNEGTPAPYGVGSVCVVRARGIALEEETTGFEPPHRLTYRIVEGAPFRAHSAEVLFFQQADHTRLVWRMAFQPKIPGTGRWLSVVVEAELRRILDRLVAYRFADEAAA